MNGAPSLAVVGAGPVGRALALAYAAGGGRVAAVVSRREAAAAELAHRTGAAAGSARIEDAARGEVVLVAVPDRALAEVGAALAKVLAPTCTALHTSGALPGAALFAGARPAGSLHPLQAFPSTAEDAALAARVAGTHFFHEGGGADAASALTRVWRGRLHRIATGGKVLYHAGAATLSNHAVALFDMALELFAAAGIPRAEAHEPLCALLAGTAANVAAAGVPAALTGPIARGDVATVAAHAEALRAAAPDLLDAYAAMARRTIVVALAKGSLDAAAAARIERVLRP